MYFPYFIFDPTMILIIIGVIVTSIASNQVKKTYQTYDQVQASNGLTASQVCRNILDAAGLQNVRIEAISGELTDHYSPREKVLRLSDSTRSSKSVAAIGVAAHECGHAIQDLESYVPLRLRNAIVPIVNFGSSAAFPILMIGWLFGYNQTLINIGLFLFSFTLIFHIVTLPVEFDASKRAMKILESQNILVGAEVKQAGKVLRAAAMTYLATTFASFLSFLRVYILSNRGSRNR